MQSTVPGAVNGHVCSSLMGIIFVLAVKDPLLIVVMVNKQKGTLMGKKKTLNDVAMGLKKSKAYYPEELHMSEYAWVGDHPIGSISKPKEEEEDDEKTWQMVTGQSGG